MKRINLNTIARSVAMIEGGAVNQSIAQIKETLSKGLDVLAMEQPSAVLAMLEERRERINGGKISK